MVAPRKRTAALLAAALLLAGPCAVARADDSGGSDADKAIRFPGHLGLTGFMDMVDARIPGVLQIRSGLRYRATVTQRTFSDLGSGASLSQRTEEHTLDAYLGVSLLGLVDASIRLPYIVSKDQSNNRKGITDLASITEDGFANVDLAGKISLTLGPFQVAPYLYGRLPSGERSVRDFAELNYGGAAYFSTLNGYLSLHANLSGVQFEKGTSGVRYRLGFAFVLWASDSYLVRFFAYGNGIEYEGAGNSDIDVDFGVQGLLFGMLTVEVGVSVRLVDGGNVDDTIKRQIRDFNLNNAGSALSKHYRDDGSWAVTIGLGTLF